MPTSAPELGERREQRGGDDGADDGDLGDRLAALDERVGAEDLLEAVERVELLGVGLDRLGDGLNLTWATFATTPATGRRAATGATASATSLEPRRGSAAPIAARSTTSAASATSASLSRIASWHAADDARRRSRASASSPASSTTAPLRSADFATWPFLRASSRFLGVAFSVLSPPAMLAPPPAIWRALEDGALSSSASQPATNGSDAPMTSRPTSHLGREADGEDVELRHDAGDEAERGVGEDQREHHRRGDLERARRRSPANASSAPSTQRAERGHLGSADELVGLGEALDDQRVAADGDEDRARR